jgi:hypothetical protein
MDTITQNFARIAFVAKKIPYSDLASRLRQWVKEHKTQTALILAGGVVIIAPGLITWPLLNLLGFSSGGVVAGTSFALMLS